MTQGVNQREDGGSGKKTYAGQDDHIGFYRDEQGIVYAFICGLKGADGEDPPTGIGKGQKKPQKENKTIHNKDSAQKPFQS